MKLKGIHRVNKVINKFIKPFGCKAKIDLDFSYYHDKKIITWSPMVLEKADKYFIKFVNDKYENINADVFLWSLLHEVGHHMTHDKWSDEDLKNFMTEKEHIENYINDDLSVGEEEHIYELYFNVKDEQCATEWAAQYMIENQNEVFNFWNDFIKVFNKFIKLNDINIAG